MILIPLSFCFFFNDTATTEIYTLSLHDALPIFAGIAGAALRGAQGRGIDIAAIARLPSLGEDLAVHGAEPDKRAERTDRKSTRLNSSHVSISYAVFCLKKKNKQNIYKKNRIQNK